MGSWNDIGFEGQAQETYKAITERLYDAMLRGFEAAANSELT
jgi:hypothetical protein